MIRRLNTHAAPLQPPWWLAPSTLFCVVIGSTMAAAAWQTDAAYRLYGTPKFITTKHILLAAATIVAFAIGSRLAAVTGRRPKPTALRADQRLIPYLWTCLGLSLFGYAIWMGVGLKNGFSLGTIRELIAADEPLLAETIRDDMFYTVQGVTTCTQFGIAAVLLGLWLFYRGERLFIWPVAALIGLAGLRAFLFSERLALIELLVPAAILSLRLVLLGKKLPSSQRLMLNLAPLVGVIALFVFFGTFEYFRSWWFYRHEFDSYSQFIVWRVSGYYTTAHNNAAMALETLPPYPIPYSTLQSFWRFPGLAKSSLGYPALTGIDPVTRHLAMLEQFGTPELNNEGGLFQPALDFGLAGGLLFWLGCGFVAGRAYRYYLAENLIGVLFYPLIFLAILETPRFLYLAYPRCLPSLIMLLIISATALRVRQATQQPALAPAST